MSYFIRILKLEGVAIYHTFVLIARFFICRNFGSLMANDIPNFLSLRLVIFPFWKFLDLWILRGGNLFCMEMQIVWTWLIVSWDLLEKWNIITVFWDDLSNCITIKELCMWEKSILTDLFDGYWFIFKLVLCKTSSP